MLSSWVLSGDPDLHSRPALKTSFCSFTAEGTSEQKVVTPAEAFQVYRTELLDGIKASGPLVLANTLYSQKIISREALDKCTSDSDPNSMIISLMNSIQTSIKLDPSAFHQLLAALHDIDRQLSTIADKLCAAVGTKQPPCYFCGSSDHWFPEVQKLSHREAERTLSYLELLLKQFDFHVEKIKPNLKDGVVSTSPTLSSFPDNPEDGIQKSDHEYARESQDDQESHGQHDTDHNGGETGGEKGSEKAGGGIPPWMMREVRELYQDKISEQAFKQDFKFVQMYRKCFVMFVEQLRSRVGKCGVKRDFNSAMLCCNMQC